MFNEYEQNMREAKSIVFMFSFIALTLTLSEAGQYPGGWLLPKSRQTMHVMYRRGGSTSSDQSNSTRLTYSTYSVPGKCSEQ